MAEEINTAPLFKERIGALRNNAGNFSTDMERAKEISNEESERSREFPIGNDGKINKLNLNINGYIKGDLPRKVKEMLQKIFFLVVVIYFEKKTIRFRTKEEIRKKAKEFQEFILAKYSEAYKPEKKKKTQVVKENLDIANVAEKWLKFKSPQKIKDEFEFQLQQLMNKLAKEEEKSRSLQSENEKSFEEIAKREKLLCRKDQEIKELKRELGKFREIGDLRKQNEDRFTIKLEEIKESNLTTMNEKDIRIEKFQEFTREIDEILNIFSEPNHEYFYMDEDGLEVEKGYMKEVQQKSTKIAESRSINGKRSLDSLLANYQEDSGRKSALEVLLSRENLNDEKDDQGFGGLDQVIKKIKQE